MRIILLISFVLLLSTNIGHSTAEEDPFPKLEYVYFQQALLRDVAKYLGEMSGYQIRLSKPVNEMSDMWVDVRADGTQLDQVLDDILIFIKKHHDVQLRWKRYDKNAILIETVGPMNYRNQEK